MNLPFTTGQFLEVFKDYNESVWPFQIIIYLLAATALFFTFKRKPTSDQIVSSILAFFWIWMGVVYHLLYFSEINKAAILFGVLFILQGMLFVFFGVLKARLHFIIRFDYSGIAGLTLIVFALIIYPVLGYMQGHVYPHSPTFELPCPTTIFTLGLLLLTERKIPYGILIIPVIWSLIGFTAAFKLGIKDDVALLIAALISLSLSLIRSKRLSAG